MRGMCAVCHVPWALKASANITAVPIPKCYTLTFGKTDKPYFKEPGARTLIGIARPGESIPGRSQKGALAESTVGTSSFATGTCFNFLSCLLRLALAIVVLSWCGLPGKYHLTFLRVLQSQLQSNVSIPAGKRLGLWLSKANCFKKKEKGDGAAHGRLQRQFSEPRATNLLKN